MVSLHCFPKHSSHGCTLLLNNHNCIPSVGKKKKEKNQNSNNKIPNTLIQDTHKNSKTTNNQPNKKVLKNHPKSLGGLSRPSCLGCDLFFQGIISSFYDPSLSCILPLLWPVPWTALLHQLHTSISLLFRMQLKPLGNCPQSCSLKFSELASLITCSSPPFLLLGTCNLPPFIVVICTFREPSHKHSISDLSWYFLLKACNKYVLLKN